MADKDKKKKVDKKHEKKKDQMDKVVRDKVKSKTQMKRSNREVVKRAVVEATNDAITRLEFDFQNEKILVSLGHFGISDGEYKQVYSEDVILKDSSSTEGFTEEEHTVKEGKITLNNQPKSTGIKVVHDNSFLFMGSDWSIEENTITFNNLGDGETVKVRYLSDINPRTDFTDVMTGAVSPDEGLSINLETALWNKLIELGYTDGEIIK